MRVTVVSGKREPKKEVVELPEHATLAHLKAAYKPRMDVHRKSFKVEGAEGKAAIKKAVTDHIAASKGQ